ncbi:hypothetical protein MPHO_11240 [Mycolicibacterium phocaicum]|nr:hypothetical protein MPHO_11240 [Mycolicibacterium phocaicum]
MFLRVHLERMARCPLLRRTLRTLVLRARQRGLRPLRAVHRGLALASEAVGTPAVVE